MPWNEPGKKDDNREPWGGNNNKNNQQPPDLDKLIGEFLQKMKAFFSGKKPSGPWQPSLPGGGNTGFVMSVIVALIVVVWFLSGLFIVNPAEEAVVLRLGQYSDVVQPGLHWIARFIETKYVVDVQKIYSFSLEGDFLTKTSEQADLVSTRYVDLGDTKKSGGSLDQSKNLVNVELNVQYRITNPRAYLFNAVDPDSTIQQVATGALSDVIGTMKLDDVLTTGRESVSSGVFERVKKVLSGYNAGLEVMAVTLKKVQAPDQVRTAFSDVNRADQDKSTFIQQAQAYASKVVPLAQGVAARTLADATAYQQQVVLGAQANIAKYQALLKVYTSSPEVTRERLYLETMQSILQSTTKVLVDSNVGNNLLYLPLDKLIRQETQESGTSATALTLPSSASVSNVGNGENTNDTH